MPPRTRASLLAGVAVIMLVSLAQPVSADEILQERGRTVGVVDGDTVLVDIWGDGTKTPSSVRFTGVNANEVGQCHASAATSRTKGLALNRVTHLYAIDVTSHSGDRLRRTVMAQQPNGSFRNLAKVLVSESLANASPLTDEWSYNSEFRAIQDQQIPLGRRLWDKDACGTGPQQSIGIGVTVHWEGGTEAEYVEITNQSSTTALKLGGWWVRNTSPSRYVFPTNTLVPPGETLTLHVGNGRNAGLDYYWGQTTPRFLDATFDEHAVGNGAFLVDKHADIRAWHVYP